MAFHASSIFLIKAVFLESPRVAVIRLLLIKRAFFKFSESEAFLVSVSVCHRNLLQYSRVNHHMKLRNLWMVECDPISRRGKLQCF